MQFSCIMMPGLILLCTSMFVQAVNVLKAGGGWPQASNHPRAHYPFPQRGRWALGREVAWPDAALEQEEAAASRVREFSSADCWALGELCCTG